MVITDNNDPDGVGTFVRWRVAFYVAGADDAVQNFFFLFDEFLVWKAKQVDKNVQAFVLYMHLSLYIMPTARQVQINQHGEQQITNAFATDLNYEHYTVVSVTDEDLPLKWYQCQPVVGKKIVSMVVQVEDEKHISVLWGGNTWAFRQALDEFGVNGAYFEDDSESTTKDGDTKSNRRYFRLLKSVDVSDAEAAAKIKATIEDIFHCLCMKVSIEGSPIVEDSPVSEYIERELKTMRNLHF